MEVDGECPRWNRVNAPRDSRPQKFEFPCTISYRMALLTLQNARVFTVFGYYGGYSVTQKSIGRDAPR